MEEGVQKICDASPSHHPFPVAFPSGVTSSIGWAITGLERVAFIEGEQLFGLYQASVALAAVIV